MTPSEAGRTAGLGPQMTAVAAPDLCPWMAEPFRGFTVLWGAGGEKGPPGLQPGARCRSSGHPPAGGSPFLAGVRCLSPRALALQEPEKDQQGPGRCSRTIPPGRAGLLACPKQEGTDGHSHNLLWFLGVSLRALLTQLSPQCSEIFTRLAQDRTVEGSRPPVLRPPARGPRWRSLPHRWEPAAEALGVEQTQPFGTPLAPRAHLPP